jgi:aryl-alcohol dehydrogenase-like predicted oxidoreductase
VGRAAPWPEPGGQRAAAVFDPGTGIERDVLPVAERYGMAVIPWSPLAGGYLSGRFRPGQDPGESHRAGRIPDRYDHRRPANAPKVAAAEKLAVLADEAGLTMVQLALAFVLEHPAITSAIIGPRTMEHLESQLAAADLTLDAKTMDRIDEIVPPGTTLNPADAGYQPPSIAQPAERRRSSRGAISA